MDKEKVKALEEWLYKELERTSKEMKDAREKKALASEARSEGTADAIMRIIKKLKSEY
jgi:hypothetical protein